MTSNQQKRYLLLGALALVLTSFVGYGMYMRIAGLQVIIGVVLLVGILVCFGVALRPWWAKMLCWFAALFILVIIGASWAFLSSFVHYKF
jgi:hypothetical protein